MTGGSDEETNKESDKSLDQEQDDESKSGETEVTHPAEDIDPEMLEAMANIDPLAGVDPEVFNVMANIDPLAGIDPEVFNVMANIDPLAGIDPEVFNTVGSIDSLAGVDPEVFNVMANIDPIAGIDPEVFNTVGSIDSLAGVNPEVFNAMGSIDPLAGVDPEVFNVMANIDPLAGIDPEAFHPLNNIDFSEFIYPMGGLNISGLLRISQLIEDEMGELHIEEPAFGQPSVGGTGPVSTPSHSEDLPTEIDHFIDRTRAAIVYSRTYESLQTFDGILSLDFLMLISQTLLFAFPSYVASDHTEMVKVFAVILAIVQYCHNKT